MSVPDVQSGVESVGARRALRSRLLAERTAFFASPAAAEAQAQLMRHLLPLLATLEPDRLGLYWPIRSEFNAAQAFQDNRGLAPPELALPFVRRTPVDMHYRAWNREPPAIRDETNIPATDGAAVLPDVVLVPCVGYTAAGYRLGYGGGYFDRWMAAHPQVTAIGVAWSGAVLDAAAFEPEPHDKALALIVTERGVV